VAVFVVSLMGSLDLCSDHYTIVVAGKSQGV
jgi:hypothetical protein